MVGDVVEPEDWLVGVLDDEILAVALLHDDVNDASDDGPGVVHAQVDLLTEFNRLELLCSQDDVPGAVLDVVASDVSELEVIHASQDCLSCPLGKLASVVFQFVSQDSSPLGVQFLPPVNPPGVATVPLVQGLHVDELDLVVGSLLNCVYFTPANELNIIS